MAKKKNEKEFDGRANFAVDDNIEELLEKHFEEYSISRREICRNFQIYARRTVLKKFLAHYELFCKTIDLPGDIVELGVYRGATLMSWANFLEIRNMGDRQKQIFGFDNFKGIISLDEKDGAEDERVGKTIKGYDSSVFKKALEDAISIYDEDRFISYKPRVILVEGDIEESVPRFIKENPGLRISLLHFDCDVYKPTKIALENLWPKVVRGGVVLFDEYAMRPWEGESAAVDEYFKDKKIKMQKFNWCPNPGGYIIKEK